MSGNLKLIREVADYCWSHNFLDIFHKFFEDHAHSFESAPEICSGEHDLEYWALFQLYLKVYEDTLTEYVQSLNCDPEEFYREVRETQGEYDDPYLKTFIDCLLASMDYESFYKVMVKEGRKKSLMKKMLAGESKGERIGINPSPRAEAKGAISMDADYKNIDSNINDLKGEGKDYDDDDRDYK